MRGLAFDDQVEHSLDHSWLQTLQLRVDALLLGRRLRVHVDTVAKHRERLQNLGLEAIGESEINKISKQFKANKDNISQGERDKQDKKAAKE